jgi:TM2 domain-containing membrane protein YozV
MPGLASRTHRVIRVIEEMQMAGQGSTGNVIAALASFFIPGLGQLLQGRLMMAIVQFVLAAVLWIVLLGWAIHLWSVLDAALYKPKST